MLIWSVCGEEIFECPKGAFDSLRKREEAAAGGVTGLRAVENALRTENAEALSFTKYETASTRLPAAEKIVAEQGKNGLSSLDILGMM